jgi:hypothetical protein
MSRGGGLIQRRLIEILGEHDGLLGNMLAGGGALAHLTAAADIDVG